MLHGITLNVMVEVLAAVIVAGFTGAFYFLFKRIPRNFGQFLRDWNGTPARPGFPEVPGVPQRLEKAEVMLAEIAHEVAYNSGTSIKDAVHRTDDAVAHIQEDLKALQQRL